MKHVDEVVMRAAAICTQVDWEEQHQSTFVHVPRHDIEEGGAARNGTESSANGGGLLHAGLPVVPGICPDLAPFCVLCCAAV